MEKPTNISSSAEYLHKEMVKGFGGINDRLDIQNGRIRSLEISRGYALGFAAAAILGTGIAGVLINVL